MNWQLRQLTIALTILGTVGAIIGTHAESAQARAKCTDFAYQQDAQAYMQQNGAGYLDRDKNGVACESLPRRSTFQQSPVAPSSNRSTVSCSAIPKVDPWRLAKPVLMGNAKASYYYKGVILAGDTPRVQAFLDCYDLTVKYRVDYASARPIWAACREVMGPGGPRGSQTVCVAIDGNGIAADDRIFSREYADQVALKVFRFD